MLFYSNFKSFYAKLKDSVQSNQDVYIFNYVCDPEHDFWYDDEEKGTHNFYVSPFINLSTIQKSLIMSTELPEDVTENLKTCLDYYYDEHFDGLVERLYIFKINKGGEL